MFITVLIDGHAPVKFLLMLFSLFMLVVSVATGIRIIDIKAPEGFIGLMTSLNAAYIASIIFLVVIFSYFIIWFIYKTLKGITDFKKSQEPSYENYEVE